MKVQGFVIEFIISALLRASLLAEILYKFGPISLLNVNPTPSFVKPLLKSLQLIIVIGSSDPNLHIVMKELPFSYKMKMNVTQ